MPLTRGEIFTVTNQAVQNNEEHKKYFAELGVYYGYLKTKLPAELREMLDRFYACTVGIESIVMETAYNIGSGQATAKTETKRHDPEKLDNTEQFEYDFRTFIDARMYTTGLEKTQLYKEAHDKTYEAYEALKAKLPPEHVQQFEEYCELCAMSEGYWSDEVYKLGLSDGLKLAQITPGVGGR